MTTVRDNIASRAEVTLDGKALPRPISILLGNEALYEHVDSNDPLGSFKAYLAVPLRISFPITDNKLLREIAGSEAEMKKDHSMTIRWMAASGKKPLTTTNLANVRITSVMQVRHGDRGAPVEEVTATVESVSYGD